MGDGTIGVSVGRKGGERSSDVGYLEEVGDGVDFVELMRKVWRSGEKIGIVWW